MKKRRSGICASSRQRERGATLIVANPRETKLDRFATFVIRYAYGDEVKTVQDFTKKGKIGDAFVKAENAVILFGSEGLGLEGIHGLATACARALNDTGHVGKPNNGLIGVWPRANDQGAWEIGFRPEEDLAGAFDKAEAVYIVGADPLAMARLSSRAGRRRPFMVVQDLFETETAKMADVVLPAQAYTEREGTFTSGERRVQRFYPAVPAIGGDESRLCDHFAGCQSKWASFWKALPLRWCSRSWPQIIHLLRI